MVAIGNKSHPFQQDYKSLYLCIACLIQNFYVILLNPILVHEYNGTSSTSNFCIFEAVLKISFDLSSMIWTVLIMYSVYATIVLKATIAWYIEIVYCIIAFILPIVAAIIPACLNIYGYDTYFCWFAPNSNQFAFKMGFFFVPLWVFFILSLIFSMLSYLSLKKAGLTREKLVVFQRFLLFPFILFITGIFGTADLIYTQVNNGAFLLWLDILSNVLISLYGLLNAVAYGLNPLIRDKIVNIFKREQPAEDSHRTSEMTARQSSKISELISV